MRRLCAISALVLTVLCNATAASASVSLKLSVSLKPERLGHGTTVGFDFDIAPINELVPPPLTRVDLRYPGTLGVGVSGLGMATCSARALEAEGPEGCPADSRMGYGNVLAEIPLAGEVIKETATLAAFRAPNENGYTSLLFYANGTEPVSAQIIFPGMLLPAPEPFGGAIHIDVPLVPSVPGAPDVAVAQIHGTLGPQHLTYFRHTAAGLVPYNPQGIALPHHCPRGGFRFLAELGFLDGSRTTGSAVVPCPGYRRMR